MYVFIYIITGVKFLNNKKYIKIKNNGEEQTGEFQEWGGSVTDKLSPVCQPLKRMCLSCTESDKKRRIIMKNTRRLLCALLVAALLILSAVPAFAEPYFDADPQKIVWSTTEKTDSYYVYLYIGNLTKKSTVTDVKSSKPSVASIYYVEKSKYSSETTYYDPENKEKYEEYYANIGLKVKKTGKSTISFKVDGKTYKKVITAISYENPVKSLQVTGINTKNLKSQFAKKNSAEATLTKNAKAGTIKVTAAKGWKVKSIYWQDYSNYDDRQYSFGGDGVATASMGIPAMKKNTSYYMFVRFQNAELGVSQTVYYRIQAASSNRR